VGPFSLGNRTFDSDMVDLVIVIPSPPFGFGVYVSTTGDCEYGAVGGKVFGLLQRFLSLLRRWERLDFKLVGVGIAWCRVCYLW
jgi:hypothetical protein